MNYDEAKQKLKDFSVDFLIVGFKHDGYRKIPANYIMDCDVANSENIYHELKKYESFKVYEVSDNETKSESEFKIAMKEFFDGEETKKEKELLQKLKNKYENYDKGNSI